MSSLITSKDQKMPITKESIIKSIIEAFSSYIDHNNKEEIENANKMIAQWRAMPAREVIAEAESVFGYTKVSKDGKAY
jgi:hypothetical protein